MAGGDVAADKLPASGGAGIQTRLLLITALVLASFLTLTGFVLDRSFRASTQAGVEEQLRIVIYSLMGSAQFHDDHVDFQSILPEPRLSQPESGLYALVMSDAHEQPWFSPSARTTDVAFPGDVLARHPGDFVFSERLASQERFYLSYAVIWEEANSTVLTFTVATDAKAFRLMVQAFRRNLYLGLGAATLVFLCALFAALRWGLRPLRTMAEEVRELEAGDRERLSHGYPTELQALAGNLDRFIDHEKRSRARYRNALEDLAHSLKTPLAVIRNALGDRGERDDDLLLEQLGRMETVVGHQLSRASVAGPVIVGRPVPLATLLGRLLRALDSAYRERSIRAELAVDENIAVRGDERDLMEIFGNLLENAFKYTHSRVHVSAVREQGRVCVIVDDDGPGIPVERRQVVLERGIRADEVQAGQGIGLAVVADLVASYRGELSIEDSDAGGARIRLCLPL